jgi:hypothetical protein
MNVVEEAIASKGLESQMRNEFGFQLAFKVNSITKETFTIEPAPICSLNASHFHSPITSPYKKPSQMQLPAGLQIARRK